MSIPTPFDPLGTLGGGLPPGWHIVESVYFDGNCCVDSGLSPERGMVFRFELSDLSPSNGFFIGNGYDSGYVRFLPFAGYPHDGGQYVYAGGNATAGITLSPTPARYLAQAEYTDNSITLTVNGQTKTITNTENLDNVAHLGIGGMINMSGQASNRSAMRLYWLEVKQNGATIAKFVPCKHDNGTFGVCNTKTGEICRVAQGILKQ